MTREWENATMDQIMHKVRVGPGVVEATSLVIPIP